MDKSFDPTAIEQRWYQYWEENGQFRPSGEGKPYTIMLPPPNVTGRLHMGHAFQDTIMDALTRYHRMAGYDTLWQPGTDHAGIATQMVVERQLAAEGIDRRDIGRDKFLEHVWKWKAESGGTITGQMRRLGTSVDWEHERFTMDQGLSDAVARVFVQLHEEGLIYRGKRLVNWDPKLHTALSDLEVISEEENGSLWHLKYPLSDGSGHLTVATTRPETMLGDTAVAVHPDDERFSHLLGQTIDLPLTDRKIPIIADHYVDPEFGSGCVKITPAHDFNDYDIGKRHDLPMINVLTDDAHMNDEVPAAYRGMERFAARKKVVADFEALGLLDRIEDHKLMVPRGDRSGVIVEPYLTDQWYVKVEPLAKPAIDAVTSGRIKFVPENWSKTYFEWMNNIQDWCISRQLWWGHRIPAWYDDEGNIYVGLNEDDARTRASLDASVTLRQDEDVLDTWFSSGLWPFSTLGWPEQTERLKTYYPGSVLVTGFDIIFFWVARMIMFGLKFMDDVPFREVYIHGLIRDAQGQKMSKSKGNVLDPIDLIDGIELEPLVEKRTKGLMQPQMAAKIEKATRKEFADGIKGYGTDALRFTFAALATTGRDIRFDLGRVEGYRNYCNKIWNAARFVLGNTEGFVAPEQPQADVIAAQRWIKSSLDKLIADVRGYMESYRFDFASQALYEFTWNEYCDWFIELTKPVMNGDDEAAKASVQATLLEVLDTLLRLHHPIMPFITEEIWQQLRAPLRIEATSIVGSDFPSAAGRTDEQAEAEINWLKEALLGIRRIRAEMNISPGKPLPLITTGGSEQEHAWLDAHRQDLKFVGRIESFEAVAHEDDAPEAAVALAGTTKLLIPLAGLIDKEAELERLNREVERRQTEQKRLTGKLSNEKFVNNAPAAVVDKEREKLAECERVLAELAHQLDRLKTL